jgi:glutaredoxin 3
MPQASKLVFSHNNNMDKLSSLFNRMPDFNCKLLGQSLMSGITIYSSMLCGFCHRAKQLLNQKKLPFNEIDVGKKPGAYQEMLEISHGSSSVPQIFIGDTHVGGCDDLFEMDSNGELDSLLADLNLTTQ